MEIIFEVPAEHKSFMLQLLQSISYVKNARPKRIAKAAKPDPNGDTTEYLLSSPANREHLRRSMEQLGRGEVIWTEFNNQGELVRVEPPVGRK